MSTPVRYFSIDTFNIVSARRIYKFKRFSRQCPYVALNIGVFCREGKPIHLTARYRDALVISRLIHQ